MKKAVDTKRFVDEWVSRYVHSSIISQHTDVYNYLMTILPNLIDLIEEKESN